MEIKTFRCITLVKLQLVRIDSKQLICRRTIPFPRNILAVNNLPHQNQRLKYTQIFSPLPI